MPENPIYDPNKIVKRAYVKDINSSNLSEPSTDGEVPKYDASKIVKRGYAPREAFQEEGFSPDKYVSQGETVEQKIDKIITNNYPDISDDRRKTFKDYAMSGANAEDIKDAILTFQGVNPKQEGSNNFYMKEVAPKVYKPVPLRADEKPPVGYDVASVWGDQVGSDDDNMVTSLAKHVWNGVVGAAEGFNSLIETSIGLTTGEENKMAKTISNKLNKFKFDTKSSEKGSVLSDKPITEFSDFFDPEQYDFSGNKLQGQILNGIESSISFAAGRGAGGATTKLANKALSGLSAYNMSLTGLLEVADEAGLKGREKYGFASVAALPQALLESSLGTSGLFTKNTIARQELKQASLELAKNLERTAAGELTEESLRKLQKEMSIAALAVNKKFASQLVGNSLEEAGTGFLQQFAEESSKQLYDKLAEDPKFNADAFSLESLGKYVESSIGELLGSVAPSTAFVSQQRKIARQQLESGNAYSIVTKGDEAVEAFKIDIDNKIENGVISQEQGDAAKFKVDAYNNYNKTTENLSLTDENKEKLFKLSFQKENLKAAIKDAESKDTEGHSRLDKMNPAELGLHNSKMKQAKALQDEIDLIVSKSEVLQQPEVAEKVVEKVVKAEEKATEGARVKEGVSSEIGAILGRQYKVKTPVGGEVAVPGKAAYEVPKKVLEETRKMKEIPVEEFNDPNFDVTVKQAKLAEALDETPEKTTTGTLQIDNEFTDDKGRQVQTFNITLPNGKAARFASSMVRFPEENAAGGFRGNTYEENLTNKENPVGQKLGITVRTLKDSGRKVIFVWNAEQGPKFGKHIGMVKERLRGKSEYGAADLDEMADLRMINMGQNPNAPAPGIFTPKEPSGGGAQKVVAPVKNKEVRDKLKGLGYSKPEIQAMEPQEANDIIKEQREKPKVKKEALDEVEVKEKKAAAKKEKKIADLRAEEQAELKREIPNIDAYKVNGKVNEFLIEKPEELKKYKEIYNKYDKLITDVSEVKPIADAKADIERRRQEELKEASVDNRIKPGIGKLVKVGQEFNSGFKVLVQNATLDESYDPNIHGDGYVVYSKIISDAEFDSNGKLSKAPIVETEIFPNKETADKILQERYERLSAKEKQGTAKSRTINAKYDAELAALESKPAEEKGKIKVKKEVAEVFDSTPELESIGTKEQYAEYLKSTFPDSELAFHGTDTASLKDTGFDLSKNKRFNVGLGVNFFLNKTLTGQYGKNIVTILYNPKNLLSFKNLAGNDYLDLSDEQISKIIDYYGLKGKVNLQDFSKEMRSKSMFDFIDSIVRKEGSNEKAAQVLISWGISGTKGNLVKDDVISIHDKNQMQTLGSKEDIQGFKNFVSKSAEEKGKIKVKKAPKEVVVEKEESIAKRKALMESILGASKLIAAYNNLTKAQKKSEIGVNLYKKIQDRVKEINYTTKISRGGTLQLVGEKGKRVYKTPVKRTEDQKAMEAERKDALRAEPTSIAHAVILDIANGAQFNVDSLADYFSEKILKNEMPSLLKNNKKGIRVGSYKTNYEEAFGQFEIENITEAAAAEEAARTLGDYFIDGFREAAIQDAIDINFKTKNKNMTRGEVEALNDMIREQEIEEKELEDILAQEELEKEEYRRQAEEEEGYLQKAKVKPATLNKFEKSVDLFYQTKDADGASKKRGLAAKRREFLEKNPTIKYIDDNMKYIYKQLEEQNIIERKGECP